MRLDASRHIRLYWSRRQFYGVIVLTAFTSFVFLLVVNVRQRPCPRAITAFGAADPLGDPARLHSLASQYRASYVSAYPYKHIIFDDFVPTVYLEKVLDEISRSYEIPEAKWKTHNKRTSIKSSTYIREGEFHVIGEFTERLFEYLNSDAFIRFLEQLTGIPDLIKDSAINGAGVSKIDTGGYLNVHADFNQEPAQRTPGWRRLNLLLYLNHNWEESDGGSLEIWKTAMAHNSFKYVGKVLPIFNRAVIFSTTELSMHGHMDLVQDGKSRLTVSTYYYTKEREDDSISPHVHSTIYPEHFLGSQSYTRWDEVKPSCPLVV